MALRRDDGLTHSFSSVPYGLTEGFNLQLNVACAAGRNVLETGIWTFVDESSGQPVAVSDKVLCAIEDLTRSFFFNKNTQQYSMRFFVRQDDAFVPRICVEVSFLRLDEHPAHDRSLVKLAKGLMNVYYQIVEHISPKNGTRVLLMTENNENLTGNLAAIDRRLRERGLDTTFRVTRSARNIFEGPLHPMDWLHTLGRIAKQDFIFVDDYVPIFAAIHLSPRTKLIQVWHAGFGFKLVGFGRFGIEGSPNPFASCHRKYTYALVGNACLRDVYTEVFGIEAQALLATGMPRLDHFLDEACAEEALEWFDEKFPRVGSRKVVLFAPTYRGVDQKQAYYDYDRIDFTALHRHCERTDSVVLFKMHRFIHGDVPIPDAYADRFYDASQYDINELFYRSDVLITDYSSCFYDFLLLARPVIFFAYDESVFKATRGVHRPLDAVAPGPVCRTFSGVIDELDAVDAGTFSMPRAADMLVDRCAERSGLASDHVIDCVLLGKRNDGVCLD